MPEMRINGCKISYRDAGRGELVLLCHSSSSHSGQWKALTPMLEADFRVIAPDFHGYGGSDPLPQDGRPYFEADSAVVAALMDEFGPEAHLVGHSLGGTIALRAALAMPERVRSLTLIEPVCFFLLEQAGHPARLEYLEMAHGMSMLHHLGRTREAARKFMDFWVEPGAFDAAGEAVQDYVTGTVPRVVDDWAGVFADAPGQISATDLAGLTMPVQLIRGGATRASASAITGLISQIIPQSDLAEIPNLGHMAAASDPAEINIVVEAFLRKSRS